MPRASFSTTRCWCRRSPSVFPSAKFPVPRATSPTRARSASGARSSTASACCGRACSTACGGGGSCVRASSPRKPICACRRRAPTSWRNDRCCGRMNSELRAGRAFGGEELAWQTLAAVAMLAAVFLRWYQLGIQVILDDEWHALNKLLGADFEGIATSFGYSDHSIPLTLYYRFLLLHGGLTEWVMHVPMLAA